MIFADAASKDHADEVGGKHRFTVSPTSKPAQREQQQQQILGFEFRRAATIQTKKLRGYPRQENQYSDAHPNKDQSFYCERRKNQAQHQHRPEISDKTSSKNDLAVVGGVEAKFKHHRVHDRDGCRGHSDARKPTGHWVPTKQISSSNCTSEEWDKEANHTNRTCFLPTFTENGGIEFGAGEKRK